MPSDLGLTSLHLRVGRNGLQMNEIRSMCSGAPFHLIEELKQSFKFHFKSLYLKKQKQKHQAPLFHLTTNKQTEPNKAGGLGLPVSVTLEV